MESVSVRHRTIDIHPPGCEFQGILECIETGLNRIPRILPNVRDTAMMSE
jgi:hypothetical protein